MKFLPRLTILVVILTLLAACGGASTATTSSSGGAATSAPPTAATSAATSAATGTTAAGGTSGGAATATTARAGSPAAGGSPAAAGSPAATRAGSPAASAGPANYGFKPGSGSAVDQVELKQPVEITFWHTQTAAREEKLKKIVNDFQAKNPNIKIKLELQGSYNDIYKKITAAINGGGLPDLAVAYENQVSEYQVANVVVPLDDYINSQKYGLTSDDLNDFFPAYITGNQYPEYKGQMLSFPFTKSVLVMYYNADKLKEAGLQVPQTWDEFSAACKKFTGDVKGYVIHIDASTFDGAVFSNGGKLISDDQTQWLFNQDPGVEYLTMLQDLVKSGCAVLEEKQFGDQTAFGQGKAVFTMGSSAGFTYYQKEMNDGVKQNWSVALLPRKKGVDPVTTSYGANIAMFKSSPEKQLAAWQFIKYFTSTDVNADWSTATGYLPIRKTALNTDVVKQQFEKLPSYKVAVTEIQQYGRTETTVKGTQDTRKFIEDAMSAAVLDPNRKPKDLLDEAVKKGNEALKQSR